MMLPFFVAVVAVALAIVSFFAPLPLPLPAPFQSQSIVPNPFVGQIAPTEGPLAENTVLEDSDRLFENQIIGPETVTFDDDGSMYIFTETGIYKAMAKGKGFGDPELLIKTEGGRPLSGAFNPNGTLFFCDSLLGLGRVDMEKRTYKIVLSSSLISFCDALAISSDNEIFIADASSLTPPTPESIAATSYVAVASGLADGRLLRYTPSDGKLKTLISNLTFANGVVLAHDESFVLVSDSSAFRTRRYWLKGPLTGSVDTFIPSLPGGCDGLGRGSNGTYWVAIYFRMNKLIAPVVRYRLLRWAAISAPLAVQEALINRQSIVIQVDGNGQFLRSFHDPGKVYGRTTSVIEREGQLFVGGFHPFVRRVDLKNVVIH